ncbi:effector-associated domain EAD1-containing protein [Lentzea sp. BCCO 10_0061]|uniref:Effector-associated domain EAD1-containing protein n=1 Tax=Lentzea sokolovensis TaxID=3095429 RepID=A0ABU4UTS7_9PSEU|nr:effector-associated domain EAD1-containing protein [Lentzea sp. BCCO 10_0061]MDX8142100.1 effector-associated domain EAD1-containing protein [Lentzea sp. BCCO 10_0061]
MARWVDRPDWSDGAAQVLHDTLKTAVWHMENIEELCRLIGIQPGDVVISGQTAAAVWPAVTREAAMAGKLETLINKVRTSYPATAEALQQVLSTQLVCSEWYLTPDRHDAVLLGPGGLRAMLDRTRLRARLLQMVTEGFHILAITGPAGSGKSYTRHLVQHVLDDPAHTCDLIVVDIASDSYTSISAVQFMEDLATRMGMSAMPALDPHADPNRAVRHLVLQFVGQFRSLPTRDRWVFIDGLDQPSVGQDVHVAVAQLAKEVEAKQLPLMRLITTGHPGNFCSSVLEILLVDHLDGVTEPDLRHFFQRVAVMAGREPSEQDIAKTVNKLLTEPGLSNLHALGTTASQLAHATFAPGRSEV